MNKERKSATKCHVSHTVRYQVAVLITAFVQVKYTTRPVK